jgi:hypothetical protein
LDATLKGEQPVAVIVLFIASCVAGAAFGWARLQVRAVILATIVFLMVALASGLHLGLGPWTIVLILIAGSALLQASYLIAGVLWGDLKLSDLSAHLIVRNRNLELMRRTDRSGNDI